METKKDKTRILIVDDEADIRDILEFNIKNEGFDVDLAESAEEALRVLNPEHKLILLDVMMGGMSGFRMAEKLRASGNQTPIIFVTAKGTENDMLTGFSTGGDDYISKPFSVKEVIARIKSVLKRTSMMNAAVVSDEEADLNVGDMTINQAQKQVSIGEEAIALTKTEYKILVLMVQNPTRLFSREDILQKVWTDGEVVLERTVDVHIARLRKKIGDYGNCIINRTGYGYSFNYDM